jgi:hypothetical protein
MAFIIQKLNPELFNAQIDINANFSKISAGTTTQKQDAPCNISLNSLNQINDSEPLKVHFQVSLQYWSPGVMELTSVYENGVILGTVLSPPPYEKDITGARGWPVLEYINYKFNSNITVSDCLNDVRIMLKTLGVELIRCSDYQPEPSYNNSKRHHQWELMINNPYLFQVELYRHGYRINEQTLSKILSENPELLF